MYQLFRIPCSAATRLPLVLLAFIALVPACAEKPDKEPTEKKEKPRLVGRVASIPADRKFVLIQSYGKWDIASGAILTTQGPEGRAANLRTSGEKLGQFAAADIQSGSLEIGDGVYTTVSPPSPSPAPEQVEKTESAEATE
jgi:hypothetical protein